MLGAANARYEYPAAHGFQAEFLVVSTALETVLATTPATKPAQPNCVEVNTPLTPPEEFELIINLSPDRPPSIEEADRLDGLSARATGPIDTMTLAPTCRASDDDEHIWVEVDALRAASAEAGSGDGFEAMIEYARSKGWLDAAGTHVRAHIA